MKRNKVLAISVLAVIVVAVLIASYVLIVLPKKSEMLTSEEIAKVEEGEKAQTGTVSTEGWDLERVNIVYDTDNVPVPVPKGYVASGVDGEHTVNDGFVIYEGEDEVTGTSTDSNVLEAQKTRNQWVWVPIYDVSEIYGVDSEGIKRGKLYNYSADGRVADNWTEDNGKIEITNSLNDREPDIVETFENDHTLPSYISEEMREEINEEMIEEYAETIESIEKYGGFYIGRYETGGLSGQAVITKMNNDINSQTWYTMYKKCKNLNGTNENVITNIIYGSLWDATLEWLVDSGEKTYSEVGTDSREWGNYYSSTFTYITTSGETSTKSKSTGTKIPTGSADYTKANNIYDMAGNICEGTLETYNNNKRYSRGGYYVYGNNHTADDRAIGDPSVGYISYGCRSILYVNP